MDGMQTICRGNSDSRVYILYDSTYIKFHKYSYIRAIGVKTEVIFGKEGASGDRQQAQGSL